MRRRPVKRLHALRTLSEVRAAADPLRLRILESLRDTPKTTKQVAVELRQNPTKLYHHVEVLARAGLVALVGTKQNRGTTERYYQARAEDFIIDRRVLEAAAGGRPATRGYESLLLGVIEITLAEARRAVAARLIRPVSAGRNALAYRRQFTGTEEEIGRLMRRIKAWLAGVEPPRAGMKGRARYGLTVVFYPIDAKKRGRQSS